MDRNQTNSRTCPACGSDKYLFRGRKKTPAAVGQEEMMEVMETKYRCTACGHVWKERAPKEAAPNKPEP